MDFKRSFAMLQYAKAQLLLAQKKNDAADVEKWRQQVAHWQLAYEAQKKIVV